MELPLLNSHRYDKVLESLYSFVIFFGVLSISNRFYFHDRVEASDPVNR